MKKTETKENYLEAIYIASLKQKEVHAIDIVRYLGFSRPTISIALKELENNGYLLVENNHITLTPKGQEIAEAVYERHEYIAKVLMAIGVSEETAYEDSCMLEHDLSEESFEKIKEATKKLIK